VREAEKKGKERQGMREAWYESKNEMGQKRNEREQEACEPYLLYAMTRRLKVRPSISATLSFTSASTEHAGDILRFK
jgi:hypothetical protein